MEIRNDFTHIPYLTSSLFEETVLEKEATRINALRDDRHMPYYSGTVLRSDGQQQARRIGSEETLRY